MCACLKVWQICFFLYVCILEDYLCIQFNLGCQEWLRTLAGTLSSVGTLLVLPITGYVSDRFGRKAALIISVFNLALMGLIRAFSVNYPMYLALQLLQTTLGAGTFSSSYIFGKFLERLNLIIIEKKYLHYTLRLSNFLFSSYWIRGSSLSCFDQCCLFVDVCRRPGGPRRSCLAHPTVAIHDHGSPHSLLPHHRILLACGRER